LHDSPQEGNGFEPSVPRHITKVSKGFMSALLDSPSTEGGKNESRHHDDAEVLGGTDRRYGAGGEDGNFVAAMSDPGSCSAKKAGCSVCWRRKGPRDSAVDAGVRNEQGLSSGMMLADPWQADRVNIDNNGTASWR